ncbi:hypothetical protein SAMN06265360_111168 [Haloechinothrix alba]|uniref:Uncharacterized protein n=1 Tax=Haloechinothrix alba TaxID=664784 RepID=A0A238XPR4_9PSEU|nr:hypothetical protein SAMN06265360_111168 [Haloechinothrix alba]
MMSDPSPEQPPFMHGVPRGSRGRRNRSGVLNTIAPINMVIDLGSESRTRSSSLALSDFGDLALNGASRNIGVSEVVARLGKGGTRSVSEARVGLDDRAPEGVRRHSRRLGPLESLANQATTGKEC